MKRAIILGVLLVVAACAGKKELDTAAEKLMAAYEAQDYGAFEALVHPEIAKQIPPETFAYTAKALATLGKPTDRSMRGISVKSGGPSEGRYILTYPKGEVEFELKVLNGTLVSFNIHGDLVTEALRKATTAEFKISAFEFLDKVGGSPRVGTTFTQGEVIPFKMQVLGLTENAREVHLRVTLTVLNGAGEALFEKTIIDQRDKLPDGALPLANPTGSLTAGDPGDFKLRITVDDVLGKRSQAVTHDFSVDAAAAPAAP